MSEMYKIAEKINDKYIYIYGIIMKIIIIFPYLYLNVYKL